MANNNKALSAAGKAKKDEFYTQLVDISNELRHYKEHFRDKVVFCNCDDPYESNFFKFFALKFNEWGLKKLICTCYAGSPVVYTQLSLFGDDDQELRRVESDKKPYKIVITHVDDLNGDGAVDLTDIEMLLRSVDGKPELLQGDGDFRSDECVELLKEADIVVTNPPFSLFREYVAQLVAYDKEFLIIGNVNAVKYKEIFPLFMQNKLWLGASIHSGDRAFYVPDDYPLEAAGCGIDKKTGRKFIRVKGVRWFTNLDYHERHADLVLYRNYSPECNPQYDNYNAIEVSKTADIPCDYSGIMGVPITFFDKYNPDQFEILWQASGNTRASAPPEVLRELGYVSSKEDRGGCCLINGRRCYDRVFIRRKR